MIDEGAHLDAPNLLLGRAVMERATAESVLDLARTSTDPDERASFFEREGGSAPNRCVATGEQKLNHSPPPSEHEPVP